MQNAPLFKSYRQFLREILPGRSNKDEVRKVSINAGFSCPNLDGVKGRGGCTYCNNEGFAPSYDLDQKSITEQIELGIQKIPPRFINADIMAYFQPFSNTYATVDVLESLYREAMKHPRVKVLVIGTRPDCLPDDVVELLTELAQEIPIVLELGLQTSNDKTADEINRGHSYADFAEAVKKFKGSKVYLGVHVIVGLPGENMQDFRATAKSLNELDIAVLKIHPLHIVEKTVMARQYKRGEISLLSIEEYCQAVAEFIALTQANVAIERFTGDSPDELHIAPEWSGDREKIVKWVEQTMVQNQWVQGSLLEEKNN